MASSMAGVSRPVKVFCWLTWYEPSRTRPEALVQRAPWPKGGRGRGGLSAYTLEKTGNHEAQAKAPRATTTRSVGFISVTSRTSQGAQVSRSAGVGLLSGGAQRTV